ncbi:MAG: GNAT family N-acetyltransferase [Candidatus Nanopelagicaceae bacterium]|nr:GNAT family N-acetyltransferase [Candidatus Nanopelagicaceae bacterium]
MELVRPEMQYFQSFVDGIRRAALADDSFFQYEARDLEKITADPPWFVQKQQSLDGGGEPVILQDGSSVPRLPSINRWMWDGEVCGRIQLRWSPGTTDLPPYCLGHIGYGVFPWKRQRGYASEALRQILPEARKLDLAFVELTTDIDNVISQRVISSNGGTEVERFIKPQSSGGGEAIKFRIAL